MKPAKEIYVIPEWMRQHFDLFQNTGGNDVEELLHDDDTTPFANVVRYVLIASVRAQYDLLMRMYAAGRLSEVVRLRTALVDALEWIDAVPSDLALPTMPGFDRDDVNQLLEDTKAGRG